MSVKVQKMNGEKEDYSEEKIRSSASRVGVPQSLTDEMVEEIRGKLYDGIPTSEIFSIIKSYLNKSATPYLSVKYNLKQALSELGPSGYPFEQYIASLLSADGYETKTNVTLMGRCISHEVDVLATKDNVTYFVEAKFHSANTQRTDVRVPLYIRARYEDLSTKHKGDSKAWIFTNTRFSTDALAYSQCVDIQLTSWGHPKNAGIMDLIESTGLHPVTILDNLTNEDKKLLLSQNIVLCSQLISDPKVKDLIPSSRLESVQSQARLICQK